MTTATREAALRVLVVEDEESFIDALEVGLSREGFTVTVCRDGAEALEQFRDGRFDVVLLDLMLPKVSGVDVCRSIREVSQVPIIIVSAKGEEVDTVLMLELGADDYVTKPYRLRELVARIRAVRRRRESRPGQDVTSTVLESGMVRLDLDARRCFVAQQEVALRRKEFDLLEMLLENAGRVVTRDALIDQVWGSDYVGDTKTLDVHIKRLRSLLEPDAKESTLITTVRGVGYRFEVSAGR